jgi:outer membrane protein OmpA-like peptidoglycan-associated protein
LTTASQPVLIESALILQELEKLGERLDTDFTVDVIGYTDSSGSLEKNMALQQQRATFIIERLKEYAVNDRLLKPQSAGDASQAENEKKVAFRLRSEPESR